MYSQRSVPCYWFIVIRVFQVSALVRVRHDGFRLRLIETENRRRFPCNRSPTSYLRIRTATQHYANACMDKRVEGRRSTRNKTRLGIGVCDQNGYVDFGSNYVCGKNWFVKCLTHIVCKNSLSYTTLQNCVVEIELSWLHDLLRLGCFMDETPSQDQIVAGNTPLYNPNDNNNNK